MGYSYKQSGASRRRRRRTLGDPVCVITPNGARVCMDPSVPTATTQTGGEVPVTPGHPSDNWTNQPPAVVTGGIVLTRALRAPRIDYVPTGTITTLPYPSNLTAAQYLQMQQQMLDLQNTTPAGDNLTSWIPDVLKEESLISGVPNWAIAVGAGLAGYVLLKNRRKGGRF